MTLQGRKVIVTGGASGMGAAVVQAFAAEGALVAAVDLSDDAGQAVVAQANAAAGAPRAHFRHVDVTDAASVRATFDAAVEAMGGLDVLVHAAGIAPSSPSHTVSVDDWDRIFAVNTRGTMLTNQAAYPHLKERGGRILNFASSAGVAGYPGKSAYAASKGAVLAWTRTIAREWAVHGITVNAIAPAISTPMYAKTRAAMTPEQLVAHDALLAASIPLGGRLGDPQRDLAPVLVFLAGEGARFITGQTIPIDGGGLMLT